VCLGAAKQAGPVCVCLAPAKQAGPVCVCLGAAKTTPWARERLRLCTDSGSALQLYPISCQCRLASGFSAFASFRTSELAKTHKTHTNRVLRVAHKQGFSAFASFRTSPGRLQVSAPRLSSPRAPLPRFGLFWGRFEGMLGRRFSVFAVCRGMLGREI
jgi:hypothetical protein